MIQGTVVDAREAIVRLVLLGPRGQREEVEAVIDTGFDGFLMLPPALIARLQLPFLWFSEGILADGTSSTIAIYDGAAEWDGRVVRVSAGSADGAPLIGMLLMRDYDLRMQILPGGLVTLARIHSA